MFFTFIEIALSYVINIYSASVKKEFIYNIMLYKNIMLNAIQTATCSQPGLLVESKSIR